MRVTGWTLHDPQPPVQPYITAVPPSTAADATSGARTILRHFEFTPEKLRAGTLMKRESSGEVLYMMKGSPEVHCFLF